MLLRFGWIDYGDWQPQKSQTGQAATLSSEVYEHKLLEIDGDYRISAPAAVLPGVGRVRAAQFRLEGVETVGDILEYAGPDARIQSLKKHRLDLT